MNPCISRKSGTRTLYIHVGTHKTGTTSLQQFLLLNEKLLRQKGLFIPLSGRMHRKEPWHHPLANSLKAKPHPEFFSKNKL